ncbi:MAG: outer membrane beta-barrel protein [Parvibaculum sp.]|uniref:outer membrane beta-barrel protein n=1 Tax=Parvibaculum sp. TaxID=2024848 RepID=UPI0025E8D90F|nr:outer membrane beta-barrel protein [Parvibaculum sp.]MCE9649107.1 outer membrane beta-barrel protein [Parvibaculum sp.]
MPSVISKALIAALVLAGSSGSAFAADPETTDLRGSVAERPRPSYDAVGIRAGAFMILPQASVSEKYNDNIYATDTNETDDFITTLGASIAVNSGWSRHALNLNAGVSKDIYADNTGENRLDWNVGANGRLDVTRDTRLSGGASYAQLHEDRGDPNSPAAAAEPTEYDLLSANAAFDQRFNRLTARVSGGYENYDYKDVAATGGGIIDQDDRDRVQYEEALRLGYDVSPDTNVYVQGTLNQRDYDLSPPAVLTNRNSDGYAVAVGSDFRLSSLAQGGIFVGYQSQSYDNSAFSDVSGLSYGADVEWYMTPLTTVTFNAAATVEETTSVGASGYLSQTVGIRVDHELLRNVLLNGRVSYSNDDYEGINRTDDIIRAGLGVDYLVNRNFTLSLGYDFANKDSDVAGVDYTRNQIGLTLTGKL